MISPLDIRQKQFGRAIRGYDQEEVKAYLGALSKEWEETQDQLKQMKRDLEQANENLKHYRDKESLLLMTLQQAEEGAKQRLENAKRDAESLVREAEHRADRVVQEALDRRSQVEHEIQDLRHRKQDVLDQIRVFLQVQLQRLDTFNQYAAEKLTEAEEQLGQAPPSPQTPPPSTAQGATPHASGGDPEPSPLRQETAPGANWPQPQGEHQPAAQPSVPPSYQPDYQPDYQPNYESGYPAAASTGTPEAETATAPPEPEPTPNNPEPLKAADPEAAGNRPLDYPEPKLDATQPLPPGQAAETTTANTRQPTPTGRGGQPAFSYQVGHEEPNADNASPAQQPKEDPYQQSYFDQLGGKPLPTQFMEEILRQEEQRRRA